VDLTDANAPRRIRDHLVAKHNRLHVLVNNAGARWTAPFAEGGWENVRRTMAINFDAAVRLTEALLPILRESSPSSIVNVSSLGGRMPRPGTGGYASSRPRSRPGRIVFLWRRRRAACTSVSCCLASWSLRVFRKPSS
jgi:short-subunit dehydrogenase